MSIESVSPQCHLNSHPLLPCLCFAVTLSQHQWKWKSLSCVWRFPSPLTVEFSRPEYWSGQLCPSAQDLPTPGIEPIVGGFFIIWGTKDALLTSGSFPMSQLFTSGGHSIGTSASVLPMNIQGWFTLGLTGLISLQSKGLSRVFPSTTVWKHQLFAAQPSLWSKAHVHTWLLEKP